MVRLRTTWLCVASAKPSAVACPISAAAEPETRPLALFAFPSDQTSARRLPLVIVQDGAPELWILVTEALEHRGIAADYAVIDRFHVNEHLAKALEALVEDDDDRRRIYDRWQRSLDNNDRAVENIVRFLDNELTGAMVDSTVGLACRRPLTQHARKLPQAKLAELVRHTGYLDGNRNLLRYSTLRKRGLAIGSGVTEGACKSVVTCRFKRSGQRWSIPNITAGLTLRTTYLGDRLQPFWRELTKCYRAPIRPN
jgi:hypothetical protein